MIGNLCDGINEWSYYFNQYKLIDLGDNVKCFDIEITLLNGIIMLLFGAVAYFIIGNITLRIC